MSNNMAVTPTCGNCEEPFGEGDELRLILFSGDRWYAHHAGSAKGCVLAARRADLRHEKRLAAEAAAAADPQPTAGDDADIPF